VVLTCGVGALKRLERSALFVATNRRGGKVIFLHHRSGRWFMRD
jgi:hypothetical protein